MNDAQELGGVGDGCDDLFLMPIVSNAPRIATTRINRLQVCAHRDELGGTACVAFPCREHQGSEATLPPASSLSQRRARDGGREGVVC